MAVQKRKRTITSKSASKAPKRRRSSTASRKKGTGNPAAFFVPLFLMVGIVFCLGFLLFMGYRTVTASAFFDVKAIEIYGANHVSKDEIERIVRSQSEKSGVWSADLAGIKSEIEKNILVKSAVVARILPDGMQVNVTERVPRAVVHLNAGDFWADEEGVILGAVGKNDAHPPFVLRGWDEAKNDKVVKDNQERVRIYLKMIDEWKDFDLASHVSVVDLGDIKNPQAIIRDSGEDVTIILARDSYGKRLQRGLEITAKKGKEIKSVDLSGSKEILNFREKQEN